MPEDVSEQPPTGESNDAVPKKTKKSSADGGGNGKQQKQQHLDVLDKWVVVMDQTLYTPPVEIKPGDTAAMSMLDDNKLIELREVGSINGSSRFCHHRRTA